MNRRLTGTPGAPLFRASRRTLAVLVGLLAAAGARTATMGAHDPEFEKYPLEKWVAEGSRSSIRWDVSVPQAVLTAHQRMVSRVEARIDGRDIAKRVGAGELIALVQFRDAGGRVWEGHSTIDLTALDEDARKIDFSITNYAFVLPGDYTVTTAILFSSTGEHSVNVHKLHVSPLRSDPLPAAWEGLPPVEMIPGATELADGWFLPDVPSKLNLPVHTRKRIRLHLLLNTTPTEQSSGTITALRRNMNLLIPATKLFSAVSISDGQMETALLDLTHRRTAFEQSEPGPLNWDLMREFFIKAKPGIVDVQTLRDQWKMRQFFQDEILRRLTPAKDETPVVVVLSGPAFYENQEPLEAVVPAQGLGRNVFYIRYRSWAPAPRPRVRPGMRPIGLQPPMTYMPLDDLEKAVEPMGAHIFEAFTNEQFRRVLATVLNQISEI
jgi:hypothetical protein